MPSGVVAGLLQLREGFLVGEPLGAVDDARGEAERLGLAAPVERDDGRLDQPVDVRLQRADAVAQLFRQHRDDPVDEIDAVAARAGFRVERRAGLHVMRDVGDVDENLEVAVGQDAVGERVVEILRVVGIDGQGEDLAEILAPARFPAAESAPGCRRLPARRVRETSVGRSCLRMIESRSTPGASGAPSTSVITPSGGLRRSGQSFSSTTTFCPSGGVPVGAGTEMSCGMRVSSGSDVIEHRRLAQRADESAAACAAGPSPLRRAGGCRAGVRAAPSAARGRDRRGTPCRCPRPRCRNRARPGRSARGSRSRARSSADGRRKSRGACGRT